MHEQRKVVIAEPENSETPLGSVRGWVTPNRLFFVRNHFNVPALDLAGCEADDLIATLTKQAVSQGHQVIIVTGDRDSYQLVADPSVRVLYNRRGVSDYALYDEAGIVEKTGEAADEVRKSDPRS